MNKCIIVYHKNCMDGVSSAFIANEALKSSYEIELLPLQYGEEAQLFEMELEGKDVLFVDFSLKRDKLIQLSELVDNIRIIDHHKTAKDELVDLPKNIFYTFDMEKSGAMLCYKEFKDDVELCDRVFRYIQDRDLWKFELPNSREVSAYLQFKVKPNDIESFKEVYDTFDIDEAIQIGDVLLEKQRQQVNSKVKKVIDVTIDGIEFKAINATENISELGNEICQEYNKPAMMFFLTDTNKVVCSLRSLMTLEDVSQVAVVMGGGGHRNASGFECDLNTLNEILNPTIKLERKKLIAENEDLKRRLLRVEVVNKDLQTAYTMLKNRLQAY